MDQIIKDNKKLVYKIAREKFRESTIERVNEFQDYVGFGYLGLMEAISKFSGEQKCFYHYAKQRIEGSIIDGVYGNKAKRKEMKELDVNFIFMDEIEGDDELKFLVENGIIDSIHIKELSNTIKNHVENSLTTDEKTVIMSVYYLEMSMTDISREMGVTVGRISQIHKSAISKLSSLMKIEILEGT